MLGRLSVMAIPLVLVCILTVVLTSTSAGTAEESSAGSRETALPASLDALYPPRSQRPVLLMAMHGMNAALAGIVVDISEDDRPGALANFENLKKHYEECRALVAEWESLYPASPVEELAQVLPSGAPGDVMAAVGKVGAVCHDCHVTTMVPAQQKYHWPSFRGVSVHDPVSGTDVDYAAFMQMLNASLTGVGNDLGQGQAANAASQFAALRSRMVALRESCDACHDSERAYFVGQPVDALLDEMQNALDGTSSDPSVVAQMGRRIGEESCTACHLVHLPAAYSRQAVH